MHQKRLFILSAALLILPAFLCSCEAETPFQRAPDPSARPIVSQQSASVSDIVETVSASVVGIRTRSPEVSGAVIEGIGSGVIVTEDGYILTNHHVAGKAWQVSVIFYDGTQADGRTVWSHAALDLAIVKVEGSFPAAPLGNSETARVGDPVVAIGTPINLQFQHTVTQGIVSAKHRTLQIFGDGGETYMEDLLQTDASINPGNSGGPLIDLSGHVIGINTLKISEAEGIGFAIPAEVAAPIIGHFIRDGEYRTPYLGLFAYDAEIARYYDEDMETAEGLFIVNIDPDGPCAKAGLKTGDILLRADEASLRTMLDLRVATYRHTVGETISLTFQRDGSIYTASAELVESPMG